MAYLPKLMTFNIACGAMLASMIPVTPTSAVCTGIQGLVTVLQLLLLPSGILPSLVS